jgi:hypothetical protein
MIRAGEDEIECYFISVHKILDIASRYPKSALNLKEVAEKRIETFKDVYFTNFFHQKSFTLPLS